MFSHTHLLAYGEKFMCLEDFLSSFFSFHFYVCVVEVFFIPGWYLHRKTVKGIRNDLMAMDWGVQKMKTKAICFMCNSFENFLITL